VKEKHFSVNDWLLIFLGNLIAGLIWTAAYILLIARAGDDRMKLLAFIGLAIALVLCQLANLAFFFSARISAEVLSLLLLLLFCVIWIRDYPTNIFFLVFPFLNYLSVKIRMAMQRPRADK
jgi:hypothetical protein